MGFRFIFRGVGWGKSWGFIPLPPSRARAPPKRRRKVYKRQTSTGGRIHPVVCNPRSLTKDRKREQGTRAGAWGERLLDILLKDKKYISAA